MLQRRNRYGSGGMEFSLRRISYGQSTSTGNIMASPKKQKCFIQIISMNTDKEARRRSSTRGLLDMLPWYAQRSSLYASRRR